MQTGCGRDSPTSAKPAWVYIQSTPGVRTQDGEARNIKTRYKASHTNAGIYMQKQTRLRAREMLRKRLFSFRQYIKSWQSAVYRNTQDTEPCIVRGLVLHSAIPAALLSFSALPTVVQVCYGGPVCFANINVWKGARHVVYVCPTSPLSAQLSSFLTCTCSAEYWSIRRFCLSLSKCRVISDGGTDLSIHPLPYIWTIDAEDFYTHVRWRRYFLQFRDALREIYTASERGMVTGYEKLRISNSFYVNVFNVSHVVSLSTQPIM